VQSPMSARIDSIVSVVSSNSGVISINSGVLIDFGGGMADFESETLRKGSTGARFANDGSEESRDPFCTGFWEEGPGIGIATSGSASLSEDLGTWAIDFVSLRRLGSKSSASPPSSCRYKTCSFTSAIKREISDILLVIGYALNRTISSRILSASSLFDISGRSFWASFESIVAIFVSVLNPAPSLVMSFAMTTSKSFFSIFERA